METTPLEAFRVNSARAETLIAPGIRCMFKLTGADTRNSVGIYELMIEPGWDRSQLHYHKQISETFIVTEGTLTVQRGKDVLLAPPGSIVLIPPNVYHAFYNRSENRVRVFLIFNPAHNREDYFRSLYNLLSEEHLDHSRLSALNASNDTYILKR